MKLVYALAVVALLFNVAVVLLTWPMGDNVIVGNDELARFVFNLRLPGNSFLVVLFIAAFIRHFLSGRERSLSKNSFAIGLLALALWLSWYLDANRWFSAVSMPAVALASEVDYPDDLEVLTVTSRGKSRAYPLQYLAYHHLVQDNIGGVDFDITYCVLVDSENVFPHAENRNLELIAARRNNSIYRDRESGSWWQQQSGEAIAGAESGAKIQSHPSFRMRFGDWREMFPEGLVMLPQSGYESIYNRMFPGYWPQS